MGLAPEIVHERIDCGLLQWRALVVADACGRRQAPGHQLGRRRQVLEPWMTRPPAPAPIVSVAHGRDIAPTLRAGPAPRGPAPSATRRRRRQRPSAVARPGLLP